MHVQVFITLSKSTETRYLVLASTCMRIIEYTS